MHKKRCVKAYTAIPCTPGWMKITGVHVTTTLFQNGNVEVKKKQKEMLF